MAIRPFVTSGIALASAGLLVAAAPTIVPPLTERDVQVAAEVQSTLTNDVIDGFIDGGTLQAALVALQDLVGDEAAAAIIQGFIDGGALQALIVALGGDGPVAGGFIEGGSLQAAIVGLAGCSNPDCGPSDPPVMGEVVNPVANGFINGGTIQAALVAAQLQADEDGAEVIQGFIDGGSLQAALVALQLHAGDDGAEVIQGFIDGGALQAALVALQLHADEEGAAVIQGFIDGGALQAGIVAHAGCVTSDCSPVEDDLATKTVDESDPGNPVANGFINGGTLQAALVAHKSPVVQDEPILAKTNTPETGGGGLADLSKNGTAGLGGTEKLVENIKSDSLVFGGAPKAAKKPRVTDSSEDVEDEGEGLVRDSLSFKPEVIIPFGKKSGDGAGGPSLLDAVTDAIKGFGGGGSEGAGAGGEDSGN